MPVFENFPYTNFHDLNLDWILSQVKALDQKVNTDLEQTIVDYINEHLAEIVLAASYDAADHAIVLKGA